MLSRRPDTINLETTLSNLELAILEMVFQYPEILEPHSHPNVGCQLLQPMLALYVFLSLLLLLCLLPWSVGTSIWLPHLNLHMNWAADTPWLYTVEETMRVISYLSSDLSSKVENCTTPIDFSSTVLSFDYASWCRSKVKTLAIVCYQGFGLDVISATVTDISAQVGEVGHLDDSVGFGRAVALAYQLTVDDLDKVFHHSLASERLDLEKLAMVHKLRLSAIVGRVLVALRGMQVLLVTVLLAFLLTLKFPPTFLAIYVTSLRRRLYAFALVVATLCEALVFTSFVSEAVVARKLNAITRKYGVNLTFGIAFDIQVVEFAVGAVLWFLILRAWVKM